jgi:hypothetical protein
MSAMLTTTTPTPTPPMTPSWSLVTPEYADAGKRSILFHVQFNCSRSFTPHPNPTLAPARCYCFLFKHIHRWVQRFKRSWWYTGMLYWSFITQIHIKHISEFLVYLAMHFEGDKLFLTSLMFIVFKFNLLLTSLKFSSQR